MKRIKEIGEKTTMYPNVPAYNVVVLNDDNTTTNTKLSVEEVELITYLRYLVSNAKLESSALPSLWEKIENYADYKYRKSSIDIDI